MNHCLVSHYIIGHLVFALVSTKLVMVCPEIHTPTFYEIQTVKRRLGSLCEIAASQTVIGSEAVLYWKL
jgi:hypothetical protein